MSGITREISPVPPAVALPAGAAPLLIVRGGPAAGRALRVERDGATIGNDPVDDLQLGDPAFGGGRLVIRRGASGWEITSEGLAATASLPSLRSGIEWSVGGSVFAWVEPGGMARGTARAARTGVGRWRRMPAAGAAALALVVALVVVVPLVLAGRAPAGASRDSTVAVADGARAFAALRDAFLREDWDSVGRLAEEARATGVPGDEIARYVDGARLEARQAALVARIRICISSGDQPCARAGLAELAAGSAVADRERPALEEELRQALANGGDAGGAEVATAAPVEDRGGQHPANDRPARRVAAGARPRAEPAAPLPLDAFRQGDVEGAIESAAADPASRRLVPLLKRYDVVLRRGLESAGPAAYPWLDELVRLEERLGAKSPAGEAARQRLSDLHVAAGLAAERTAEWERALHQYERAARVASGHGAAAAGLQRIRARARDAFFEGYALRDLDREEAVERFQLVTRLLPSGDETYEKARRWLERMRGGRSGHPAPPVRSEAL